jgi:hypothetical protein
MFQRGGELDLVNEGFENSRPGEKEKEPTSTLKKRWYSLSPGLRITTIPQSTFEKE